MSAENANAPAGTTPAAGVDPAAGAVTPAATSAPVESTDTPETVELKRQLAASESRRQQGEENYGKLRTLQGRQATELAGYRSRYAAGDQGNSQPAGATQTPPSGPAPATTPAKTAQELLRDATVDFKLENPDWKTHWPKMTEILDDPIRVSEAVVYNSDGSVDFGRSLIKARDAVKMTAVNAATEEGNTIRATAEGNRTSARRDAVISGSGASAAPETVDLSKLRNDPKALRELMVKQGLLDPLDPPTFQRGGNQTKR